jgi:putative copper export protein
VASTSSRPGYPSGALGYAIAIFGSGAAALLFGLWLGDIWPQAQVAALVSADTFSAWGLPISRMSVDLSAVGAIGMLVTCALLPREDGGLGDAARRCLRSATWLALLWGVSMAALLVFTWSDITAQPAASASVSALFPDNGTFPEAVPYLTGAVLALIISAAASITDTPRGAVILLLLAWYNLLPLTTQGHADHSPVIAYALSVHVMVLSLWVGGLAGLLIHVRASRELLTVAVPRFSMLALACYVGVAASGVVMAWENLGTLPELWRSRYGLLLLCKLAALVMLGVFGWWHRRHTVRAVAGERGQRAFVQLAAAEIVIMAAAVALGVALSRGETPATIQEGITNSHGSASATFSQAPVDRELGRNVSAAQKARERHSY